jgi:acetyl-CoA C-acetyltransferase
MTREVFVAGVGQTAFGEHWDRSYRDLLTEAGLAAIQDAQMRGESLDAVYVGSMSTGKLLGQEHVAPLMLDGAGLASLRLPATRIEAAGASGAVALNQAVLAIKSGVYDRVVVGGIEKMTDVPDAEQAAIAASGIDQEWELFFGANEAALHALIAKRHMREYGTTLEQLAAVAVKNHAHAVDNPYAHFRRAIDQAMVSNAPMVADPLTVFHCAPQSDGAACVVLAAGDVLPEGARRVRVAGIAQASDTLRLSDRATLTTWDATVAAARDALQRAGVSAADVDVAEVHDAYTVSEILAIEDLGLVQKGDGGPATLEGRTGRDGDIVVNPGGGLKARGHPAGASGVAQVCELAWQLRGEADARQVVDARFGLAHNCGGTGATAVVTVLEAMA